LFVVEYKQLGAVLGAKSLEPREAEPVRAHFKGLESFFSPRLNLFTGGSWGRPQSQAAKAD
jgi:hypothetical protein